MHTNIDKNIQKEIQADPDKTDFLREYFIQVESQVQFADTRAALLFAGNALLLGINGELLKMFAGCPAGELVFKNVHLSSPFICATIAAFLLIISLAFALWAALPSKIHGKPPKQFYLLSHVARITEQEFIEIYDKMSIDKLQQEMLIAIHGKACFATIRFGRLKKAIKATLFGLALQVCAIGIAVLETGFLKISIR